MWLVYVFSLLACFNMTSGQNISPDPNEDLASVVRLVVKELRRLKEREYDHEKATEKVTELLKTQNVEMKKTIASQNTEMKETIAALKKEVRIAIAEVKKDKMTAPLPGWNVAIDPYISPNSYIFVEKVFHELLTNLK